MKKADITTEDSIKQNLETFCYEVGSEYEQYSIKSARRFLQHIGKEYVIDLGSGDGAATNVFIENGNKVTAVDINQDKLNRIKGAKLINEDFITFLSKPITGHVFFHHALEHCAEPELVLGLIAANMRKNKLCYIAVPMNDSVHSVHHVAFESADELIPKGLEVIEKWSNNNVGWYEHGVVLRK